MKVIKAVNDLYVRKLEWFGEDLLADFYNEVIDKEGESNLVPYLTDIRINLRSKTFSIYSAFMNSCPVNIVYRVEPEEEVVYVEEAEQ